MRSVKAGLKGLNKIRLLIMRSVKAGLKGLNKNNRGCNPRLGDHILPPTPEGVESTSDGAWFSETHGLLVKKNRPSSKNNLYALLWFHPFF